MAIQDLRFPKRQMVKQMVARCELAGATIDMDKDGYFAHSFTMPAWLAAMPTGPGVEIVAKEAAIKKPAKPKSENGACAQIRAWAKANPEATKADGVLQFPTLNPSTIQIQMRKVRMGEV